MSVRQIKDVRVTCPNGHQVAIPKERWEHEVVETEDKSERGMGVETHHQYSVEGYECDCPGCSASIDAKVDIWEYPDGTIETSDKTENVVDKIEDCFVAQFD